MLSMHIVVVVVVVVGSFIHCLLPEEGAWPPSHPTVAAVTVGAGLSLSVRVLETPGLHGSDEEVLRAEGLVVESVAVACATSVQVSVDVERLAAPSTCKMLSQWLPFCLAFPPRCFPPVLKHLHCPCPSPTRDLSKTT